ncbi:hypothetical protein CIPAW_13G079200 [Carya illinoinensis]|uniref:Uncharacterized protein n=1 Tax=Carya illinoinensis TaxID=32201 RepID=A0A8T1NHE4_CARIL|nr:hypothetical protein CIPAW_13G079200 [Carya illinoinensis]
MRQEQLIFIPAPGVSHLVSTLEFAKHLIARDDRILITIIYMKSPSTPLAELYTRSIADSQPRIQLVFLPRVDPPPSELLNSPENFIYAFVENHVPKIKETVRKIISSSSNSDSARVVALVLDFFCLSMIDVGTELGLPSYLFLTFNAGFLGFMLHLPTRHNQISTEFTDSDPELSIPGLSMQYLQVFCPHRCSTEMVATALSLSLLKSSEKPRES